MKAIILASLALLALSDCMAADNNKPNILFILADDLRPDGLGALGNKIVKTCPPEKLRRGIGSERRTGGGSS